MLEDDPNANTKMKAESDEFRWGPKHKGAQILANFYSSGKWLWCKSLLCDMQKRLKTWKRDRTRLH